MSLTEPPTISVVIPAYNAEKTLGAAVRSLQAQTFQDWEAVVADDGSSDGTVELALKAASADPRIRVLTAAAEVPERSAYMARRRAIMAARAPVVAPVDADDLLPPTYLAALIERKRATGAGAVYPRLMRFDTDPNKAVPYMADETYLEIVAAGRELVARTLRGWGVSCAGGVIDKALYLGAFPPIDNGGGMVFADERLSRRLLYDAPVVAFSHAEYLYRNNSTSATNALPDEALSHFQMYQALTDDIREMYGAGSEEYALAYRQEFYGLLEALANLCRHRGLGEARRAAEWSMLEQGRRQLLARERGRARVRRFHWALLRLGLRPTAIYQRSRRLF